MIEKPYYPIVYVRGYAMTAGLIESTTADPYMGFNDGATMDRQTYQGNIKKWFFESPLIRLMKDYEYSDVYYNGENPLDEPDESEDELAIDDEEAEIPKRCVAICRYYELSSKHFGSGERLPIEDYARELHRVIAKLKERLCTSDAEREAFRVYLVAHSMGGLVCRCFLQNDKIGTAETRRAVDKVFTYATPHNGIDLRAIGNVPGFATFSNATNFDRTAMAEYLKVTPPDDSDDVSTLDGKFDPNRFFCLVGTNPHDYPAGMGMVKKVVGPLSDGLVRISNAATWGPPLDGPADGKVRSPRAFVYRSHSGELGIVNSEEGYQNLARFLFGDVRVDGVLDVEDITLPPALEKKKEKGQQIRASYHIETRVDVRGLLAPLHRRLYDDRSAVHRKYDELVPRKAGDARRAPHLFSQFLDTERKVKTRRRSLGFSVFLGVRVPEYEVDRKLWFDGHYPGSYIFRDTVIIEVTPPATDNDTWSMRYSFESDRSLSATRKIVPECQDGHLVYRIPIRKTTAPGINATLILTATPWS